MHSGLTAYHHGTSSPLLLRSRLRGILEKRRKILSVFLTAGFPRQDNTVDLIEASVAAGADMIEIGIPFSDPIADGPVIQKTSDVALRQGMNLRTTLDLARAAAQRVSVPIVLMGYINPVLAFGLKPFMEECSRAGVSGLIFPDLPPEEGDEYIDLACQHHIATVFLASPTTPPDRMKMLDELSTGFVYLVSVAGVTGVRSEIAENTSEFIRTARGIIHHNPMIVGFGIATPRHARDVALVSDGVIVGSAYLSSILDAPEPPWKGAIDLLTSIRTSLDTIEVP